MSDQEAGVAIEKPYLEKLGLWPAFTLFSNPADGPIPSCKVASWKTFELSVQEDLESHPIGEMIYRGQRRHDWPLAPTLTRKFDDGAVPDDIAIRLRSKFKLAMRGRGVDLSKLEDVEVWAYGQHFGLVTPLLDWTESPFVALFFAFADDDLNEEKDNPSRAIYRLNRTAIESVLDRAFFEPTLGDNGRLVNQAGLFTVTPSGDENLASAIINALVDAGAVDANDPNDLAQYICKFHVPNEGRSDCLNMLRKMNIHHASLFPDPGGASSFCNDWLSRAIEDRRRQQLAKQRASEEAAKVPVDVPRIAAQVGSDTALVAEVLEAALGTDASRFKDSLGEWARKIDARYIEEAGQDWPRRPSIEAKLRLEFRKLLTVLGSPEATRQEVTSALIDFYKARYVAASGGPGV